MIKKVLEHLLQASGGATGIHADLRDLSLASLLELIHTSRQTGLAEVETFLGRTSVTLRLGFISGELVDCAVLDWRGLDALFNFPQDAATGHFEFMALDPAGLEDQPPLASFSYVMSEWARLSDEWPRYNAWLGSPSTRFVGTAAPFNQPQGCSARAAAHAAGRPLHEVAAWMAEQVQAGALHPKAEQPHQEWQFLRLPAVQFQSQGSFLAELDGTHTLGQLHGSGTSLTAVRTELLRAIQRGYRFPGCGWVMRDLIWEQDWEEADRLAI